MYNQMVDILMDEISGGRTMITPDMPIRIGNKECRNRITMAPTVKFNAGTDGIVTGNCLISVKRWCGDES